MKKTKEIFKIVLGTIILIVLFAVGVIDRIILIPCFWIESPSLTKAHFYNELVGYSVIRVFAVAILTTLSILIIQIF